MNFFIETFLLLFSFLPFNFMRFFARRLGELGYFLSPRRRKLAWLNLQTAFPSYSRQTIRRIALDSFRNLAIVAFEVCWYLKHKQTFEKTVQLIQEQEVFDWVGQKNGLVYLILHQANWEVVFPTLTRLCQGGKGVGKPFKQNKWFYELVLQKFREQYEGKIISPDEVTIEFAKVLKKGCCVGFVDHSYLDSSYSYPLFETPAPTSYAPAFLAYRYNVPLVPLEIIRTKGGYQIQFGPMLFPDCKNPLKSEVPRLMDRAMQFLEQSLHRNLGDWMWMHNRWKFKIKRRFKITKMFSKQTSEGKGEKFKVGMR